MALRLRIRGSHVGFGVHGVWFGLENLSSRYVGIAGVVYTSGLRM